MQTISSILPRLVEPGPDFRGTPFWAWNARLDPDECRAQIRAFREMGLGGFFMHSRTGLATEYLGREWFDCVRACVDEAGRAGMRAWMYDEDRWPSGSAGGRVTAARRFRARHLAFECVADADLEKAARRPRTLAWFAETPLSPDDPPDAPGTEKPIAAYRRLAGPRAPLRPGERRVRHFVEVAEPSSWYNGQTYVDTLNPAAIREFVRVSYEPYARELGADFPAKVPGCFTDEPHFGHWRPWTDGFARAFRKAHGYDILDRLPELWRCVGGEEWSRARFDYIETATTLFVRAYARTIGRWCGEHGALFTGHVLEEDTVSRQAAVVGSAMRFYEHMQAPGIDQLGEIANIYATAKQCASAAHQCGRAYRLVECYGVTGWDFPLEGHKALGDWLLALGVNHRCQHLAWYSMAGEAKRDYPASISRQSPWFRRYKAVEDRFARLGEALADGDEVRPLLVLSSNESAWGCRLGPWTRTATRLDQEQHADLGELLGAHVDFDYGDEDMLARLGRVLRGSAARSQVPGSNVPSSSSEPANLRTCEPANRGRRPVLAVGRAKYDAVLVPALETIRPSTLAMLSAFAAAGGRVFFVGDPPPREDGVPSDAPRAAFAAFTPVARGRLADALAPVARRVSVAQNGVECAAALVHLRAFPDGYGLFVCNTSTKMPDAASTIYAPRVRAHRLDYPRAIVRLAAPRRGARVFELDADTGAIRPVPFKYRDGAFEFAAPLGRLQSRFFYVCRADIATAPAAPRRAPRPRDLALPRGPMRYKLDEPNAIVLDRAAWRAGDETADRPEAAVLDIDEALRRDFLGAAPRGGQMVQPWCAGDAAPPKTVRVRLRYRFSWRGPDPATVGLRLAIERPDLYAISLNGAPVPQPPADGPWWVDPCLRLVDLPTGAIRRGANELTLDCAAFHEGLPGLEAAFLLGAFGVAADGATATPLPAALRPGDVCAQGLPNYSGNLSYFVRPRVPAKGTCRLRIDRWRGTALGFRLNGGAEVFRPWPPYEAVFDDGLRRDGTDEIEIVVYGHRRNAFGPFYVKGGVDTPDWCGPGQMRETSDFPVRALVPFGVGAG